MAFNGYLIKIGGASGTILPMKYIKPESYKATPNQRLESEAERDITGTLHRTTAGHLPTKIEFNTPYMTNVEVGALIGMIKSAFTVSQERKLNIQYYNEEDDTYKTASVYVPDINYTINHIDTSVNLIYYEPIRIAFIEY